MASDPIMAFLLVGMGIDELSMSPSSLLAIKKMIRSLRYYDMHRITNEAMQLSTGKEIEDFVSVQLQKLGVL
jgi:phosphotransferase system enzyme I (PtsI)